VQTRRAMAAIQMILDEVGATWSDVVKVTKYLTDMRDADGMHRAMRPFFGDWQPASTMVCINQLSSPGARVELDMIVALPQNPAASRYVSPVVRWSMSAAIADRPDHEALGNVTPPAPSRSRRSRRACLAKPAG
jgi:hypothetical protein